MRRTESQHHFLEQIGGYMDNRIYGYARVSSREQNEVRNGNKKPVDAMRELGISRSCYYRLYNKIQ